MMVHFGISPSLKLDKNEMKAAQPISSLVGYQMRE